MRDRWQYESALQKAEARIQELEHEQGLPALPFSALQAVGPPDDRGKQEPSWYPARNDSTREWLILDYDRERAISEVVIHETHAMGRVSQVSVFSSKGDEQVLWAGQDPTPQPKYGEARAGTFCVVPQKPAEKTRYVKLSFENKDGLGCFAIDAVGVVDLAGETHWAVGATASSSYGDANRPLYRTVKSSFMQPRWYPDGHGDTDY